MAEELADIMFVLDCIASEQGIDLADALVRNVHKKNIRDRSRYTQLERK